MSAYREFTGKSVEEALKVARQEFGVELNDLDFEILTAGSRHDPGGLGSHAEDAAAARGQNLEIEVVQLDAELLSGILERLFDALAGKLAVRTHQRRLPRRP
jgi:predicted RNA-binding protein Jag